MVSLSVVLNLSLMYNPVVQMDIHFHENSITSNEVQSLMQAFDC